MQTNIGMSLVRLQKRAKRRQKKDGGREKKVRGENCENEAQLVARMNHGCSLCEVAGAYLDSSAISAAWTCFLSANCEGKRRVMMSWSRAVGLYFLFLKNWEEKRESSQP